MKNGTFLSALVIAIFTGTAAFADDLLSPRQARALQELFDAGASEAGENTGALLRLRYAFDERLLQTVIGSLADDGDAPVFGKTGPLLVEFSDYQCGYCKRMYPVLQEEAAAGRVRVMVLEFPILGEESHTAARYALAAWKQQKYAIFHDALMRRSGEITPEALDDTAMASGLDMTRLRADIDNEEIAGYLEKSYQLALLLNVRATPSFVVNGTIVRGALKREELQRLLSSAQ